MLCTCFTQAEALAANYAEYLYRDPGQDRVDLYVFAFGQSLWGVYRRMEAPQPA